MSLPVLYIALPAADGRLEKSLQSERAKHPQEKKPAWSYFDGLLKAVLIKAGLISSPNEPKKPTGPLVSAAGHVTQPKNKVVSPARSLVTPSGQSVHEMKPSQTPPKVVSPEHALVSPTGQHVSSQQTPEMPSGFRGRVELKKPEEPSKITPVTSTSSVRSKEQTQQTPALMKLDERRVQFKQQADAFRARQGYAQASRQASKPQAALATPTAMVAPKVPGHESTGASKPSGGSDDGGSKPTKKTPELSPAAPDRSSGTRRGINVLGAYNTGHVLGSSANTPGGGTTALNMVAGRAVGAAHGLLNRHTASHVEGARSGREGQIQRQQIVNRQLGEGGGVVTQKSLEAVSIASAMVRPGIRR